MPTHTHGLPSVVAAVALVRDQRRVLGEELRERAAAWWDSYFMDGSDGEEYRAALLDPRRDPGRAVAAWLRR